MPSPAAAAAATTAADDHHAMFGDEVEDDEDESEMEMDEDSEEYDEEAPATAVPPSEDLNSSPSSSTDDDDRLRNPSNGATTTTTTSTGNSQNPQVSVSVSASHRCVKIEKSPAKVPFSSVACEGYETPDQKRMKLVEGVAASEERKVASSTASLEDSRRLFQRLWTDEDEIKILQGFYEFTSQRGTTHHAHQHDTGPFYDQIRTKLQFDFNKNQLVEKLRRLKKKYRNVINRMGSGKDFVFKSAHDQATFEISRKIWSNSVARGGGHYDQDDDDGNDEKNHGFEKQGQKIRRRGRKRPLALAPGGSEAVAVEVKAVPTLTTTTPGAEVLPTPVSTPTAVTPAVVEDAMRNCLSPLFKEMLQPPVCNPLGSWLGGGSPFGLSMMPFGFMGNMGNLVGSVPKEGEAGDKWRKQQILELEVFAKRLELVQEQVRSTLEELRSLGG